MLWNFIPFCSVHYSNEFMPLPSLSLQCSISSILSSLCYLQFCEHGFCFVFWNTIQATSKNRVPCHGTRDLFLHWHRFTKNSLSLFFFFLYVDFKFLSNLSSIQGSILYSILFTSFMRRLGPVAMSVVCLFHRYSKAIRKEDAASLLKPVPD